MSIFLTREYLLLPNNPQVENNEKLRYLLVLKIGSKVQRHSME